MHYFNDGTAQTELEKDLAFTRELNIRTLPAYLIQYGEKAVVVRSLIDFENFLSMIEQLKED